MYRNLRCSLVLAAVLSIASTPVFAQTARDREQKAQAKPAPPKRNDKREEPRVTNSGNGSPTVIVIHTETPAPESSTTPTAPVSSPSSSSSSSSTGRRRRVTPRIAFISDRSGNPDLYIMWENGGELTRLTETAGVEKEPTFSPMRGRVTFIQADPGSSGGRIITMNASGRQIQPILPEGLGAVRQPVWCDRENCLVCVSEHDGNPEIYRMDSKGQNARRLTNHPAADVQPAISPTSHQIAFVSERDGKAALYLMNNDGSGLVRLTPETLPPVSNPVFSPDGTRIAFAAGEGGTQNLYTIQLDTRKVTQRTTITGLAKNPVFSPDGGSLAFAANTSGSFAIYTVSLKDGIVRQLTFGPGNDTEPAWW